MIINGAVVQLGERLPCTEEVAGYRLRRSLLSKGEKISLLGDNDEIANYNYVKHFVLDLDSQYLRGVVSDKEVGKKYGVEWGEAFHYIGPKSSVIQNYIE